MKMNSASNLLPDTANLTDQVVAALANRIAEGEFTAGAKLPTEGKLVISYGVSRTVVREAISQLRARGLVETRRGIGTFASTRRAADSAFALASVDPTTLAEVLALLELRISLETEAAALAAKRRSETHLARLETALLAITRAAETGGDAADADFDFHLAVAEASRNHYFTDLLQHLGRAVIPRTRIDSPAVARKARIDYLRQVNREHEDIFRAIARTDSDAARAAMRTHLANSRERLRQLRVGDEDA